MPHIVVTHASGRNANRQERIDMEVGDKLSLGRASDCNIQFDPEHDDLVSRKHAVITLVSLQPPVWTIEDDRSRNGTFVNGRRIDQPARLASGDEIDFGAGGPRLRIRLDPAGNAGGADAGARTRESSGVFGTDATQGATADRAARGGVGRRTVELMIAQINSALSATWRKKWLYSLAGVLTLLVVIAGTYGWLSWNTRTKIGSTRNDILAQVGKNSKEIAINYQDAVVKINVKWRLYDKVTGKQVFHKFIGQNPAYIKLPNNQIVRWLVEDDQGGKNRALFKLISGTGFVVNQRGFILTNKHIAAGWQTSYEFSEYEKCNDRCGLLYTLERLPKMRRENPERINPSESSSLHDWIPSGCILPLSEKDFQKLSDIAKLQCADGDLSTVEGRNELLEVNFPKKMAGVQAQLVRTSYVVDLALIKVDVPDALAVSAEMAEKDYDAKVGTDITVIGYPATSEKTFVEMSTVEAGTTRDRKIEIPEPTVVAGKISNIGRGVTIGEGESISRTYGDMGHLYQLSIPRMPGNSGGPVFDDRGKVVGIFTYSMSSSDGASSITFAVPIKYGYELLALQNWR